MIMYDVADDNDNGDDECHCQLLKYCDAFHYKINFPSTWEASYRFSRGGKRARSNRSSWSLTHSEVNREKTYPFFTVFLLFQCIVVFLFKTFWGRLECCFFYHQHFKTSGGRLECCLICEPVSKLQRAYENLIHLSSIKEGMQGERNSPIFYICYIYRIFYI